MSSYHYSFYSPTDCTAWVFSHRFHCLLRIFSHRFHRFTQNFLLNIFSHRFHRFTQIVWVPSRGCTCLKCTNQARSAPTKQNRYSPTESTEPTELLAEDVLPQIAQIYTDCLGAFKGVHLSQVHQPSNIDIPLVTLVHLRQVHPLKLAGSVNSACSVGGTLLLRRQGYLRYYLPHPNHLCRSVKSVGGHCLLGWCT